MIDDKRKTKFFVHFKVYNKLSIYFAKMSDLILQLALIP